jgi:hypothetical protein
VSCILPVAIPFPTLLRTTGTPSLTRIIHERFCCNHRSAATTSLRPAGSSLEPLPYVRDWRSLFWRLSPSEQRDRHRRRCRSQPLALQAPVSPRGSAISRRTVMNMRVTLLPAYFWGFWSLITLLVLSSAPAYAEWVKVDKDYFSPGLWTIYIDPDTIRREGNLVTVWQLVDFKAMQGGRSPTRFFSTKTHKQFDCAEKRFRLLAFTEFTDGMGTGEPTGGYVDKNTWLLVEPESVSQALWEMMCGKK